MLFKPPTKSESKCFAIWSVTLGLLFSILGLVCVLMAYTYDWDRMFDEGGDKMQFLIACFGFTVLIYGFLKMIPGSLYLQHRMVLDQLATGCKGCLFIGLNGFFCALACINLPVSFLRLFGREFPVAVFVLFFNMFDFYAHYQLMQSHKPTQAAPVGQPENIESAGYPIYQPPKDMPQPPPAYYDKPPAYA